MYSCDDLKKIVPIGTVREIKKRGLGILPHTAIFGTPLISLKIDSLGKIIVSNGILTKVLPINKKKNA